MNLIENYKSALEGIAHHVEFEGYLGNYTLSFEYIDCFYLFSAENEELLWSKDVSDIEQDSGNYYQEECRGVYKGSEFTLAIVYSSFGDDDYGIIFKTKNEVL